MGHSALITHNSPRRVCEVVRHSRTRSNESARRVRASAAHAFAAPAARTTPQVVSVATCPACCSADIVCRYIAAAPALLDHQPSDEYENEYAQDDENCHGSRPSDP